MRKNVMRMVIFNVEMTDSNSTKESFDQCFMSYE